jgi:CheY-like chemotaxis protein
MKPELPILIVEDDKVDVMAIKRAVKQLQIQNPLVIAANGEEALHHLQDLQNPLPTLILLDINMPKMNGIEFLRIIKDDRRTRRIPVVILTTSHEDRDRMESFDIGVAGYMVKPVDHVKFVDIIDSIHRYWSMSASGG